VRQRDDRRGAEGVDRPALRRLLRLAVLQAPLRRAQQVVGDLGEHPVPPGVREVEGPVELGEVGVD
jgi:hypothetical protein